MVKSLKLVKAGTESLVLAFFLCASLSSCSLLSSSEKEITEPSFLGVFSVPKEDIVIVEPSKENRERDQLIVIQLSQMLESSQVKTPSARAEVFYDLGIIYDRLGLEASARSMFLNSLSERADFAPSYNIIGVYLAQNENFQDAYDAFDSALELDPDNLYPLMNRAIALYYAGRYSLAVPDMERFCADDVNDPYRMLWLYLIESKTISHGEALSHLKDRYQKASSEAKNDNWAFNIVDYYLGKKSKKDLIEEMSSNEVPLAEKQSRLCEGYFYIGKEFERLGQDKLAYDYFKLSLATQMYGYLEYRYAFSEIKNLRKKYDFFEYSEPSQDNEIVAD